MSEKRCIVISCVSFETAMIVEPAVGFGADEVHLFHYTRNPNDEAGRIYQEFYNEVCFQIRDKLPKVEIIEHAEDPVYDFQLMFRDLLKLIADLKKKYAGPTDDPSDYRAEIFINSSAGTSQFSAAAIVTGMMNDGVKAFTVGTREFTIKTEDIRNLYYKAGRPVGLTEHTHTPRLIPKFEVEPPDKTLVLALRAFNRRRNEGKPVTATGMIQELKDKGLWEYEPMVNEVKTASKQKEIMFYQRHYLKSWINAGWIEKPAGYSKYSLTDSGLLVISTFFAD